MSENPPTRDMDQPAEGGLELRDRYMREIADHRRLVGKYMQVMIAALVTRSINHDLSKFGPDEFDGYMEAYPTFCRADYGSALYREACRIAKPAIRHHVTTNRHHPEAHVSGVDDMNLVDLLEMVCDWCAASMRRGREDDFSSLKLGMIFERFEIGPQLQSIIANTVRCLSEGEGLQ